MRQLFHTAWRIPKPHQRRLTANAAVIKPIASAQLIEKTPANRGLCPARWAVRLWSVVSRVVSRPLIVGKDLATHAAGEDTKTCTTPAANQTADQSSCRGSDACVHQPPVPRVITRPPFGYVITPRSCVSVRVRIAARRIFIVSSPVNCSPAPVSTGIAMVAGASAGAACRSLDRRCREGDRQRQ
jgi:hypothetical protein